MGFDIIFATMKDEVVCIKPNVWLKLNEVYTVIEKVGFTCKCGSLYAYYTGDKLDDEAPIICKGCGSQFQTTDKIYHNAERFERLNYNQNAISELLKVTI